MRRTLDWTLAIVPVLVAVLIANMLIITPSLLLFVALTWGDVPQAVPDLQRMSDTELEKLIQEAEDTLDGRK